MTPAEVRGKKMNPALCQLTTIDECQLQPDRIDIWQFPLEGLPENVKHLLNQDEQQRANRFHFPRHQRRFTAARIMMRLILGRYLNEKPESLHFSYNHYGKPELHSQSIQFNISHSKELALLAVGQTYPMGIDLEFFSSRPYEGIAKDLFSEKEFHALTQLPPLIKTLAFFHVWSQKEAFIKACGMGLSYPTKKFSVPILPTANESVFDSLNSKQWQMVSFMPALACCGALCHEPVVKTIRIIKLSHLGLL